MIYYFSGTGNSRFVAEQLARATNDMATDMTAAVRERHSLPSPPDGNNDTWGFVFPVHAWGLPRVVEWFVRSLITNNAAPTYIYMVCTCGDDIGRTNRIFARLFRRKGAVNAFWSVQMPNTYISLPGFDTDLPAIAAEKVSTTSSRIKTIAAHINQRISGICEVYPGAFPRIKSYLIRPLFRLFLTGDRQFSTSAACTHCGRCVRVCPMRNIACGSDGRPRWNGHCTDCLACYHVCPSHAIRTGWFSKNKGQYNFSQTETIAEE